MKWRIGDIVDLEYLLHKDAASPSDQREAMHERDRGIFLENVMPGVKTGERPARQAIIRAWLHRRREMEPALLPGETVEHLNGTLRFWFLAAGMLLGGGAGVSFLTYTGDSPVNVFVYLALFIFSQLLLLPILLVLSMYRLTRRSFPSSSPLYRLIGRFMLRTVLAARSRVEKKLSADRRLRTEKAIGAVIGKSRTYGVLFFLPLFILTQLLAMGFNLGLLAATLFKVVTSDIAFGWQSTIQLSPSAVHSLARAIAVPWSWAVGGDVAFPSLAQVEGSRIILKEGIYHLSTPDLASWWPFLCFAVLVYGLAPRLLLFLGAAAAQRRLLGSLDFRQGACERLIMCMTTPLVSTRGRKVEEEAAMRESVPDTAAKEPSIDRRGSARKNLLVMIPDEIYDACSREEIESVVNRGGVYDIMEIIRFNQDYASDRQLLARLRGGELPPETEILVIQEAWQPPIMEYIDFIRQLRGAVGDGPCIRIGLIGKPVSDTVFTPPREEDLTVWAGKITAAGDPCMYVEGLVTDAA
jgi:hypothetical protein